jgi:regulatory protein
LTFSAPPYSSVTLISVDAYVLALGWLARRELTEKQVRQRLARRGLEPDGIDEAITRLKAERAIDDARVAGAFARTAARLKGRGPVRLERDLQALGIERGAAKAAVKEILADTDERTLARQALARRWRRADRPGTADAARLYRALLRQGFGPTAARAALTALGAADDDSLDGPPGRDELP